MKTMLRRMMLAVMAIVLLLSQVAAAENTEPLYATEAYENAQDNGDAFVVSAVSFYGISSNAVSLRYHTDGTVEEMDDPLESFGDFAADMLEMVQKYQNGKEVDIEEFLDGMTEKNPDLAEFVNTCKEMYQLLGAEQFINMMNSTDENVSDTSQEE